MQLNKKMYIIKGNVNSCIYNSDTGDIFHIDNETLNLAFSDNLDDKNIVKQLMEHHIFVDSVTNWYGDISKLVGKQNFYPKFAWIEITTSCNLKCIHCYNESDCHNLHNMSIEDFKCVINKLVSFGVKRIQIIGGEPLLHPNIIDMIEYAYQYMDFIEIFTNGTLIDQILLEAIKKYNVNLAFSIYSYDEDQHNSVTQNAESYIKSLDAISRVATMDIKYRVARVIMKDVALGQKNTDLFTLSSKKDYVRLSGRANLSLYDKEMLEHKVITKEFFKSKFNFCKFVENINVNRCFSKNLYISADMIVYPCVMERRVNYGKLNDLTLDNILQSSIRTINKSIINSCKLCEFRYFCNDCRPDSIGNNIYSKPWFCTYIPEEGRWVEKRKFIDKIFLEKGDNEKCLNI